MLESKCIFYPKSLTVCFLELHDFGIASLKRYQLSYGNKTQICDTFFICGLIERVIWIFRCELVERTLMLGFLVYLLPLTTDVSISTAQV